MLAADDVVEVMEKNPMDIWGAQCLGEFVYSKRPRTLF